MASLIPAFVDTVVHWNAREFSKDAPLVIKITASILLGSTCTADETHHDDGKGIVLLSFVGAFSGRHSRLAASPCA